jgi:hypothetical protein
MNGRSNQAYMALVCLISFHSIFTARIVPGDTLGTISFTFDLGPQVHTPAGNVMFVGALNQGVAKNFALSLWSSAEQRFSAWSPEKATINGVAGQDNPLYDAAITHLGLLNQGDAQQRVLSLPIVVTQARPADIFFVQNIIWNNLNSNLTSHAEILLDSDIKDASGVGTTDAILAVEGFETEAIFAAVTPSGDPNFGAVGSGIAVSQIQQIQVNECPQAALVQINVQPGADDLLPRASALDVTSASIKINSDVTSISSDIDLHYSKRLKRLYVGLQVQGGPGATDGARGVVVGRFEDKKLVFEPIAPDGVFTLQDKIVGGTGANTQVSIHKVRTMLTTTGLDYLIVVGNVGAPGATQNQVYALPLVYLDSYTDAAQGTLANVLADPEEFYSRPDPAVCSTLPHIFLRRSFVDPATQPDEVFTETSVQALVGINPLPVGDITDINISNDVVFVSVADAAPNQLPGIFYSQALFAQNGTIAAWTPWQRVAGTTDPVFSFAYKALYGSFAWLTGQTASTVNTVKESVWGTGSANELGDLVKVLGGLFPIDTSGIQGLFDLPLNTPGLLDISLFIATGYKKIALVQSGSVIGGTYTPTFGDFQTDLQEFTSGEITQNFPVGNSRVVAISGGVLDAVGPITAAAIGVNSVTNNGYLFAGGAYGLAVLTQPDGTGWSTLTGLSTNFTGLEAGMRFIRLGAYNFVRKLIFDEGFLYVLTDTQLDRIDVAASDFASGTLSVVTVAILADIGSTCNGTLFDVAVSDSFALLASSNGLYRVGNDANIQTAVDHMAVDWTNVVIPEGMPVVQQLQPIASNSLPNGFAKTDNGNVYILDAYAGLDSAQQNRYTVQSVVGQPITSNTIVPLPDIKVKDILTAFNVFNNYVDFFNFDGTDNFYGRDRRFVIKPMLRDELFTAPPYLFDRSEPVPLGIDDAYGITTIVRSSASGAWLVSGDFGLRVNE